MKGKTIVLVKFNFLQPKFCHFSSLRHLWNLLPRTPLNNLVSTLLLILLQITRNRHITQTVFAIASILGGRRPKNITIKHANN